jgi:hypothetical protein
MAYPDPALQFDAEVFLVKQVIAHPAGFDLDFGGGLIFIRTSDQETYEIEWNVTLTGKGECQYKSFTVEQIDAAARFFVEKRHELRLGIDFDAFDIPEPVEHERCPQ